MFDIGFSELVLIGILALLVLGPKRLPEVARTAGRWMAQLRRFVTNVKQDFDRELHGEELAELRKLKQELDETRRAFADSGNRMMQNLADLDAPRKIPHPDDPVTEPVILPPRVTAPAVKPKARRLGVTRKVAATNGRPTSQRRKPGKRR
jgi:sec-independent protein translocase protein TatB